MIYAIETRLVGIFFVFLFFFCVQFILIKYPISPQLFGWLIQMLSWDFDKRFHSQSEQKRENLFHFCSVGAFNALPLSKDISFESFSFVFIYAPMLIQMAKNQPNSRHTHVGKVQFKMSNPILRFNIYKSKKKKMKCDIQEWKPNFHLNCERKIKFLARKVIITIVERLVRLLKA